MCRAWRDLPVSSPETCPSFILVDALQPWFAAGQPVNGLIGSAVVLFPAISSNTSNIEYLIIAARCRAVPGKVRKSYRQIISPCRILGSNHRTVYRTSGESGGNRHLPRFLGMV
jgi:hypothetical protein